MTESDESRYCVLRLTDERTLDEYSLWQVQFAFGPIHHTPGREERR
jgi:hypothetical protein